MKSITIFVIDKYINYIEFDEKDHPSLTVSTKDGCLIVSDFEGILDIIPLVKISRCRRR